MEEWCSSSYLKKNCVHVPGVALLRSHKKHHDMVRYLKLLLWLKCSCRLICKKWKDMAAEKKWWKMGQLTRKRVTWHCQSRLILCLGRRVACTWRHPVSTANVGPCKRLARVSKHQRKMRVTLIWFWNQTCSLLYLFFAHKRASYSTIGQPCILSHMSWYNGATIARLCVYHGVSVAAFSNIGTHPL